MATEIVFNHQHLLINNCITHVITVGDPTSTKTVLFLHGWPEDWTAFKKVMRFAANDVYAVAIDLPGIGESTTPLNSGVKSVIARHIIAVIAQLGLQNVIIVGHDIGGQITYSCLKENSGEIKLGIIMSVVIPGLEPWDEVLSNPHIWHFAFHKVPALPEILITGKENTYFDFFYNTISAHPEAITAEARSHYVEAYRNPSALKTGFDWYRAFSSDAEENSKNKTQVEIPVLYLRGEKEGGNLAQYVKGIGDSGFLHTSGALIADSGHFTPEEQSAHVWNAIHLFISKY